MMENKVCIVTGANAGIGLETARGLAAMGATVILACRDLLKGEAALADIQQTTGNKNLHLFQVHLDQQASIRLFASAIEDKFDTLDVLVNNAGVFKTEREITADGFEATFAINHLAYFLLTHLLLNRLIKTPGARIINVSSNAHRSAYINFKDLQLEKGYASYKAYARSKLANVLFTIELSRRLASAYPDLSHPTVNCLHPGVVATNITGDSLNLFGLLFKIFRPFYMPPAKGARTSIYLATSPKVEGVTGKYFEKCKEQPPSTAASQRIAATRLYQISAKLTGVPEIGDS